MTSNSRNDALGFADRTRKNLLYIEHCKADGADVHVVTQLALSLLGLVVFPRERQVDSAVKRLPWDALRADGWPAWDVTLGQCETLDDFARHLRNAVAHGHVKFSSEDRALENVTISIEDFKSGKSEPYWRASIQGRDLRQFCLKFIALVEDSLG